MALPNLFIPGAGKSATSSLHEYLNQHPDIYMSRIKEPHFFSDDSYWGAGLCEYEKLFEEGRECRIRGESSTGYMIFPNVIERIKSSIHDPKFIFILRNPVDRAYSHYCWLKGMGFEDMEFRDAVLSDMKSDLPHQKKVIPGAGYTTYYHEGCYGKEIPQFQEAFGSENILIIESERLKKYPLETLVACFSFLGLAPLETLELVSTNETKVLSHPSVYRYWRGLDDIAFIRQALKRLMPAPMRLAVKNIKSKSDQKLKAALATKKKPDFLSQEDRVWLAALYRDDIDQLRTATRMPFIEWQEDFPIESTAI